MAALQNVPASFTTQKTSPTLNIAIIGAGIAGLTAAIALLKNPSIQVTIYEQAPAILQIGASIGLGPNGLRILEKLGIENALGNDVCFRYMDEEWPMIYRHWKTGEVIDHDVHRTVEKKKHYTARYRRADLRTALLENLSAGVLRLGKRVADVLVGGEEGVTVSFDDGTSADADILLGADGIHSNVRKSFVPEHKLSWTGWVALRSVFDASILDGVDIPADAAHWIGHDRTFFHSKLGKSQFTIVGGFNADPKDPNDPYKDARWNGEGDMNVLKSYYKGWHPSIQSMIAASPYTRLYPNVAGAPLSTFTFHNRITLLGDAAHTHGGGFAAGGSLGIDDAYCFSLALKQAFPYSATSKPSAVDLKHVFRLYEETRKPHVNRILELVHKLAKGRKEKAERAVGETEEELIERVKGRPDPWWISEHDVEKTFWETVRRLEAQKEEIVKARL